MTGWQEGLQERSRPFIVDLQASANDSEAMACRVAGQRGRFVPSVSSRGAWRQQHGHASLRRLLSRPGAAQQHQLDCLIDSAAAPAAGGRCSATGSHLVGCIHGAGANGGGAARNAVGALHHHSGGGDAHIAAHDLQGGLIAEIAHSMRSVEARKTPKWHAG